jgi:hypothetical protein
MHISCRNRALKVLSVQMHWSRDRLTCKCSHAPGIGWAYEQVEPLSSAHQADAFLCSQNPRWDSIVRGFSFEFLIMADAMGPNLMRTTGRQIQKKKRNPAWNVNGATTFMRFQDAAFRDVLPATCWHLSVFLYGFKIYSMDSSKMIVDSPDSWTWTAYFSKSTSPSVTSSRMNPPLIAVVGTSTEVP